METHLLTAGNARPSQENIAVAAYYLYAQSGFQDGREQDNWLQAEKLLSAQSPAPSQNPVSSAAAPTSSSENRERSKKKNSGNRF